MSDILSGFVLAAGAGTRLRPLTRLRPKALCPVDNVPLVDLALSRLGRAATRLAVNAHHHWEQIEEHLGGRVHVSVEHRQALGTAGALGQAREWLAGSDVVVVNADAWNDADLTRVVTGWDRERIRLCLAGGGPLEPSSRVVASWRPAQSEGRLEVVDYEGLFIDCGTPADYLASNMAASGGRSVIGDGAVIEGTIEQSVIWPGSHVARGEHLVGAIRAGHRFTILVR
jgi:MurNAc alpha-1-phosphate uridylyltransferase